MSLSRVNFNLSIDEQKRYDRQIKLSQCGLEGQARLKHSTVAVIGAGGLGCAALTALVMTGVGRIRLFDFDRIHLSNLHRQSLYRLSDCGQAKVDVAKKRLQELNPHVDLITYDRPLRRYSDLSELQDCDLIIDCTDRFDARANIAAICKTLHRPHCYASVSGSEGQLALFYQDGPCFRCTFENLPSGGLIQSCDQGGVLGVSPQWIGGLQAQIAIDYLLSDRPTLALKPKLQLFSMLPFRSYQLNLSVSKSCPLCHNLTVDQQDQYEPFPIPISAKQLAERLYEHWSPLLIDVRTLEERTRGSILGSVHLEAQLLIDVLKQIDEHCLTYKHIKDLDIPLSEDELALIKLIFDPQYFYEIVVFCARGPRAEIVARLIQERRQQALKELNHQPNSKQSSVYELVGGYSGWSTL